MLETIQDEVVTLTTPSPIESPVRSDEEVTEVSAIPREAEATEVLIRRQSRAHCSLAARWVGSSYTW